jgi:plasmid stabilization system protein ParE
VAELEPEFHPEASDEAIEAYAWYFERDAHAAVAFDSELDRSLMRALDFPESGSPSFHGTRAMRVSKFPFQLIYRPSGPVLRVFAVAHTSRRPGYWRGRL